MKRTTRIATVFVAAAMLTSSVARGWAAVGAGAGAGPGDPTVALSAATASE